MQRFALLSFCALLLGCGESRLASPPMAGKGDRSLLPAHETSAEKIAKADQPDPRDNYPEYYGFTDAPGDAIGLPGESEPVRELLVGWADGASQLAPFFTRLVGEASLRVHTTVFAPSEDMAADIRSRLAQAGYDDSRVKLLLVSLDSIWIRDYGPLVVRTSGGGLRIIDARYYFGRWDDDVLPTLLSMYYWQWPVSRPPLEMEGGNFLSDGEGRCIATEHVVVQNQALGYDHADVESIFKTFFGCREVHLLPQMGGEGTGHVDMYLALPGPQQAIVGQFSPDDDPDNAQLLDAIADMLTDAGFAVRRIPMPSHADGAYRSYTNGLAIDGAVLVPVYADDRTYESKALKVIAAAYPGRQMVTIDSTDIIQWAGAIHCTTMTVAQ